MPPPRARPLNANEESRAYWPRVLHRAAAQGAAGESKRVGRAFIAEPVVAMKGCLLIAAACNEVRLDVVHADRAHLRVILIQGLFLVLAMRLLFPELARALARRFIAPPPVGGRARFRTP